MRKIYHRERAGILCLLESFPLTYELNGFKSRINRHL